jgi:phage gpG-like protein
MSELEICKRLKQTIKRAEHLNRMQLVVGIPSDENSRKESTGITNAELGVIHEFGAPEKGIPERSFMRSTVSEETGNLGRLGNACIAECLKGQKSAHDALAEVGAYLQGKIVEKITDGDFVANKDETAKRKKSSKPLIDTGQLRASITYEVRENES